MTWDIETVLMKSLTDPVEHHKVAEWLIDHWTLDDYRYDHVFYRLLGCEETEAASLRMLMDFMSKAGFVDRMREILRHRNIPEDILERHADDGDYYTDCVLLANPSTPANALRIIAKHITSEHQWSTCARHPNIPIDVQEQIRAEGKSYWILLQHHNVPLEWLAEDLHHEHPEIRYYAQLAIERRDVLEMFL